MEHISVRYFFINMAAECNIAIVGEPHELCDLSPFINPIGKGLFIFYATCLVIDRFLRISVYDLPAHLPGVRGTQSIVPHRYNTSPAIESQFTPSKSCRGRRNILPIHRKTKRFCPTDKVRFWLLRRWYFETRGSQILEASIGNQQRALQTNQNRKRSKTTINNDVSHLLRYS